MATKITLEQFFNRIDEFIADVMVPNMGSSVMRGLVNVAARLGIARNFIMRQSFLGMSMLEAMEISGIYNAESGHIDVDTLESGVNAYFEVEEEYSKGGFHLDKGDFDAFISILRGKVAKAAPTQPQEDAPVANNTTSNILFPKG